MSNHPIEGMIGVAMENIKKMVDVNTIVGEPVQTPDGTTIIPISKVAFGFGAGGSEFNAGKNDANKENAMFGGGSGGGVTINPVAFLVVNSQQIKLLPISSTPNAVDKIIDTVPEVITKINSFIKTAKEKKNGETTVEVEVAEEA